MLHLKLFLHKSVHDWRTRASSKYVESAKTRIRRTRAPLRSGNEPNELGFNPAKRGCLIFADGLYSGESHYAGF